MKKRGKARTEAKGPEELFKRLKVNDDFVAFVQNPFFRTFMKTWDDISRVFLDLKKFVV